MNDREIQLVEMLGDWWNNYTSLTDRHPNEDSETVAKIHDLQRLIMARVARRQYPSLFNSVEGL